MHRWSKELCATITMAVLSIAVTLAPALADAPEAWRKPVKTQGLPPYFKADEEADLGILGSLRREPERFVPKSVEIDRKPTGTSAAIVGISSSFAAPDGKSLTGHGSGFLVAPCVVVTAAHVVVREYVPAKTIRVGWGGYPKDGTRADLSLDQNFANISTARILWQGPFMPGEAGAEIKGNEMLGKDRLEGVQEPDDWAVLELDQCADKRVAYLRVPPRPAPIFATHANRPATYMAALGYPKAHFSKLGIVRCALVNIDFANEGIRPLCRLSKGISGGPLLHSTQENLALGVVSMSFGDQAVVDSTMGEPIGFTPTGMAGFAMGFRPEPPPPGCISRLKTIIEMPPHIAKLGLPMTRDDTPDLAFLGLYRTAAALAAGWSGKGLTFIPNLPDPFMCDLIIGYAEYQATLKKIEPGITYKYVSRLVPAVPEGEWHLGTVGLRIAMTNGMPLPTLTGREGPVIFAENDDHTGYMLFHRRASILVVTKNGKTQGYTIDFRPGKAPLLVKHNGQPVLQWMEPGPPMN
ncbi:MAG: hypothetical protein QM681_06215 [Novosphingobium sp.]